MFLGPNFFFLRKLGLGKKWHNRGMWIILKWAQFQPLTLIRIPHHVEPVNAGSKKLDVAKGSVIKGLSGFYPAKWRCMNLAWSHHSGRIACFGPGLTLLVASLRPQLADLSCDAAGSGILACSKSWVFTAFVAETCGSYCNLQKAGYDCKTIIKNGPQAMFSNGWPTNIPSLDVWVVNLSVNMGDFTQSYQAAAPIYAPIISAQE